MKVDSKSYIPVYISVPDDKMEDLTCQDARSSLSKAKKTLSMVGAHIINGCSPKASEDKNFFQDKNFSFYISECEGGRHAAHFSCARIISFLV